MSAKNQISPDLGQAAALLISSFIKSIRERSSTSKLQLRNRVFNLNRLSSLNKAAQELHFQKNKLVFFIHAFESGLVCPSGKHLELISTACSKESEYEVLMNVLANFVDPLAPAESILFLRNEADIVSKSTKPYWVYRDINWFVEQGKSAKCNPVMLLNSLFEQSQKNSSGDLISIS